MFTAPTALPDDPATLQLILRAALAEIERLQLMIAGLQRNRFGRRSERLDDETLQHGLEDLEQSLAEQAAGMEAAMAPPEAAPDAKAGLRRGEPAKRNRGALPAHLPRVEVMIDIKSKACPVAGARCTRSARIGSKCWTTFRPNSGSRWMRRPRYPGRGGRGAGARSHRRRHGSRPVALLGGGPRSQASNWP